MQPKKKLSLEDIVCTTIYSKKTKKLKIGGILKLSSFTQIIQNSIFQRE